MLKPYETKLQNIKNEISKIGVDVVESLELCLRALDYRKITPPSQTEKPEDN